MLYRLFGVVSLFILWASCICAVRATAAEDGLAAYWTFDEGKGDVLHDTSGNSNDGVIHNPVWQEGLKGGALLFSQGVYVEIPKPKGLFTGDSFTVETWIKPAVLADHQAILCQEMDFGFYFGLYDGSVRKFSAANYVSTGLTVDEWAHLAMTYDGTTARLYENGRQIASWEKEGFRRNAGTDPLYIGFEPRYKTPFHGSLDEMKFYNRLLTAEEAESHYRALTSATVKDIEKYYESMRFTARYEKSLDKLISSASPSNYIDAVFTTNDFRQNLSVFLKNPTDKPMEVQGIYVNDKDIKDLVEKNQDVGAIMAVPGIARWYDILPNPIPPHDEALLKIRLGAVNEITGAAKIKLVTSVGTDEAVVPVTDPYLRFRSYCFNDKLNELTFYFACRRTVTPPEKTPFRIRLGGKDVTTASEVKYVGLLKDYGQPVKQQGDPAVFPLPKSQDKWALYYVKTRLPRPMKHGDVGVLKVHSDVAANYCMIKYVPPFFPLSMMRVQGTKPGEMGGQPPDEWLIDCRKHFIDTLSMDYEVNGGSLDTAAKHSLKVFCYGAFGDEAIRQKARHPARAAWVVWDEAHAYNVKPMEMLHRVNTIRENSPAPYYLHDWYDRGHAEYNFIAMSAGVHYYPIFCDPLQGAETWIEKRREMVAPMPVEFGPGVFRCRTLKEDPNSRWSRFATPEEGRLMVYMAIAHGAKGLNYFAYNINPAEPLYGVGITPEPEAKALWTELGRINLELTILRPLLQKGEPADLATITGYTSKHPDTRKAQTTRGTLEWNAKPEVASIICGDEAIALFVINHDYEWTNQGLYLNPIKNLSINLQLPTWFKPADAFEIGWQGAKTIAFATKGGNGTLKVDQTDTVKVIVISADPKLRSRLAVELKEQLRRVKKL